MFLLDWYEQYLDLKNRQAEKQKELQYCEACETLKIQIAIGNEERKVLIEKLTAEKSVEEHQTAEPVILNPLHKSMRWSARRELLEAESREAAKALRRNLEQSNPKNDSPLTVSEIEKELGVTNG